MKKMNVIISTSCEFASEEDVKEYRALSMWDLPEDDMNWPDVARVIMGYSKIVLIDEDGKRLAVWGRREVTGMAIGDKAIAVHGSAFKRFDTDGEVFPKLETETSVEADVEAVAEPEEETEY